MSELLLALGAVVTAAGIAALGIGVSGEHDAVGIDVVTSGTIATVGGLVVLALGICVRALQRIEWAVRALTVPHPAQSGLAASAVAATPEPTEVRVPLSAKPAAEPSAQLGTFGMSVAPAPSEAAVPETVREKFPALVKLDTGPVTQDVDLPLSPKTTVRAEADDGKSGPGHSVGSTNGAAPIRVAVAVRPDGNPRRATSSERGKISTFDSLWPKAGQLKRHVQGGGAQAAAIAAVEPAQASAPEPTLQTKAAPPVQAPSVSILKSGVVDGMAYTLYSDGSIEAQLPNGTLRFGSITELRNHIERGS